MTIRTGPFDLLWTSPLFDGDDGIRSRPDLSERHWQIGFGLIILFGAALRFWNLGGASLWLDESASLAFSRLPATTILFSQIDNHPPLFYLIQHVWMSVTDNPALVRVPAALIGTASLAALMLLARDQVSRRVSLLSGLLFSVSTGQIYYSQEVRMYGLLVLGLVLACWGLLGLTRAGRLSARSYAILYVAGAAIAIYAQIVALFALAIMNAPLLWKLIVRKPVEVNLTGWFITNLVLLAITFPWLIQIPAMAGSFPGLPGSTDIGAVQWHLRNGVGFPGLSGVKLLQLLADAALLGSAALGGVLFIRQGRFVLGTIILAMLTAYPAIVFLLSIQSSIVHARVFLPLGIVIALSVGNLLRSLASRRIMIAGAAFLAGAGLASSAVYLNAPAKPQDMKAGVALIEQRNLSDAPILTCDDFLAATAWETRNDLQLYTLERGEPLRYPGADFWRVLDKSIIWYRKASNADLDAALGGGLLPERGFASLAERFPTLILMKHGCSMDDYVTRLDAFGYSLDERIRVTPAGSKPLIIDRPNLEILVLQQPDAVAP